jgi:hypothetical protein
VTKQCISILTGALVGIFCGHVAGQPAQTAGSPSQAVVAATDGILAAFETHSVVGIADYHGLAQEEDFYVDLIRDPRFAREVGNVVVEFGGAAQQKTIDRYTAGEDISYEQLRKVWTDTVGWNPTVMSVGYPYFFAQVRAVNEGLPPSEHIHVWLGEPPIDWSTIKRSADLTQLSQRDRYPAELIRNKILANHEKTLVLYGSVHFFGLESVQSLVEQSYPGSFYVVTAYLGFPDPASSQSFEQNLLAWRDRLRSTDGQKANTLLVTTRGLGLPGDAVLYLGPAASLTESPVTPDLYLDSAFRKEINRRSLIMDGTPLDVTISPVSPAYIRR